MACFLVGNNISLQRTADSTKHVKRVIVAPMVFLDKVLFTTLKLSVYGVHILQINLCSSSEGLYQRTNGTCPKENSCIIFVRKAISNR